METISALQALAFCLIVVSDSKGRLLYRCSIAVPEASANELVGLWATARVTPQPGAAGKGAHQCEVVLGAAAGDPWRTVKMDLRGSDWLKTVELWGRIADAERIRKALAVRVIELERLGGKK